MLQKEVLIEEKMLHAGIGEHIGYELGAKMVKDYTEKYQEVGSLFVGRNVVEQILAQPGCIGIKIFNALNEHGQKTLVFVGVDETGTEILQVTTINHNGILEKSQGIVSDRKEQTGWFDIIGL